MHRQCREILAASLPGGPSVLGFDSFASNEEKASKLTILNGSNYALSMPSEMILKFKEDINPFLRIFDQLSVVCAAVRLQEKWISVFTRISLSNSSDSSLAQPQLIKAASNFVAIFAEYAPEEFDSFVAGIEVGKFSLAVADESYEIFVNRVAAGMSSQMATLPTLQFLGIVRPWREYAKDPKTYRPSIELSSASDRLLEVLSHDESERISKLLRMYSTPFNGLQGLFRAMGSNIIIGSSDQTQVYLTAVLPFDARIQETQIEVRCPESLASRLWVQFFFSPAGSFRSMYSEHLPVAGRPGWCIVPFAIPWQPETFSADAHIYYAEEEIDKFLSLGHWGTGNWRLAVDNDFDPGARLLQEALAADKKSDAFEQAVVRLLNLAGIAATWYGTSREGGKPDLAAYYEDPHRRVLLLGECTLEKPQVKFSPLKSRADKLSKSLGEVASVLPIVFTSCDPVEADYNNAANDGILLLGRNQVAWLFQLIRDNARPSQIMKELEQSLTNQKSQYPMVARWESRY